MPNLLHHQHKKPLKASCAAPALVSREDALLRNSPAVLLFKIKKKKIKFTEVILKPGRIRVYLSKFYAPTVSL